MLWVLSGMCLVSVALTNIVLFVVAVFLSHFVVVEWLYVCIAASIM